MAKFRIERTDTPWRARLFSSEKLTPPDFDAIAAELGTLPVRARKAGLVAARRASRREAIETRWNGKESSNTAGKGDYVVANLSAARAVLRDSEGHANVHVIEAARFPELYERDEGHNEFGDIYRPRALAIVEALHFPGGFEILAPWGEVQVAPEGYLLRNGNDIYGNNSEPFEATYAAV